MNRLNVGVLIEKLNKMPKEAPVVITYPQDDSSDSDYCPNERDVFQYTLSGGDVDEIEGCVIVFNRDITTDLKDEIDDFKSEKITPLIIETHKDDGVEWGVSFSDHDPDPEDYIKCDSEQSAYRLQRIITGQNIIA